MSDQPAPRRPWRRRLLREARNLGLAYLLILVVMMLLENSLVYFPTTPADRSLPDPRYQEVRLRSADGTELHAVAVVQPGATRGVLYCHGNAGNAFDRADLAAELATALGATVLVIDYPGYGLSSGKPSEAGCYAAADAGYDWLRERFPEGRIVLLGKSLGGGVAVDVAARRGHEALALYFPFTTLPDAAAAHYPWLPVGLLMRNRFDNLAKIGSCRRPVFVAHGTADEVVPFKLGRRLFEAANDPKQFAAAEGFGHEGKVVLETLDALKAFLAVQGGPGQVPAEK